IDPAFWQPLADYATGRTIAVPAKLQEWLDQADRIAERDHFFHWELEFPEVFFDRNGQPLGDEAGFDAVIGNPPYVRQELLKP
ncbi:Eco57I restriction-modification methylase domain-containing protein, partial [Streptococcus pyogenes]